MKYTFFFNTPAWYKFFLAVFVIFSFYIISFFLALLIGIPIFHLSLSELQGILSRDASGINIFLLKYLQIFQTLGTFFFPAFLLAWLFSGNSYKYLKLNNSVSFYSLILVIFSVLVVIPLINFTGYLNSMLDLPAFMHGIEEKIRQLEKTASELMGLLLNTHSMGGYLMNIIIIAVLPGVCEELLFRGVFQRVFTEWAKNKHIGIILAAALFSIFHFQFYGFVPRFLLGVYFGYLLVWSNTLWLPIIAHFVNNAFAVTFYHFSGDSPGQSLVDDVGGADGNLTFLFLSIIFFVLIVGSIYYSEKMKRLRN